MTQRIVTLCLALAIAFITLTTNSNTVEAQPHPGIMALAKAQSAEEAAGAAKKRLSSLQGWLSVVDRRSKSNSKRIDKVEAEIEFLKSMLTPTCLMAKDPEVAKECWEVEKQQYVVQMRCLDVISDDQASMMFLLAVSRKAPTKYTDKDGGEMTFGPAPTAPTADGLMAAYSPFIKMDRTAVCPDGSLVRFKYDNHPPESQQSEARYWGMRRATEQDTLNLNVGWYLGAAALCGAGGYLYGESQYPDTETQSSFKKSAGPLIGGTSALICVGTVLLIDAATD